MKNQNKRLEFFVSKLLKEAIPLWLAKSYSKTWNKEKHKEWFNGKYRTYIPYIPPEGEAKPPERLVGALDYYGYIIVDYAKGLAKYKDSKNVISLGKVLQKVNRPDLAYMVDTDPHRTKTTNKLIVISRHPYDIAGMSSDRGWKSCVRLGGYVRHPDGTLTWEKDYEAQHCNDYLGNRIRANCLVAYIIDENDKNIKNPKAMIAIKPYEHQDSGKWYYLPDAVYGQNYIGFKKQVRAWLDSKQGKFPKGTYSLIGQPLSWDDYDDVDKPWDYDRNPLGDGDEYSPIGHDDLEDYFNVREETKDDD